MMAMHVVAQISLDRIVERVCYRDNSERCSSGSLCFSIPAIKTQPGLSPTSLNSQFLV